MYKLLKWIYDLGYNKGFEDGEAHGRKKHDEKLAIEKMREML